MIDGVALGIATILRYFRLLAALDVDAASHVALLRTVFGIFQHFPQFVKPNLQTVFCVLHFLALLDGRAVRSSIADRKGTKASYRKRFLFIGHFFQLASHHFLCFLALCAVLVEKPYGDFF